MKGIGYLRPTKVIHRSKKDGDMSILPQCIVGIK